MQMQPENRGSVRYRTLRSSEHAVRRVHPVARAALMSYQHSSHVLTRLLEGLQELLENSNIGESDHRSS